MLSGQVNAKVGPETPLVHAITLGYFQQKNGYLANACCEWACAMLPLVRMIVLHEKDGSAVPAAG